MSQTKKQDSEGAVSYITGYITSLVKNDSNVSDVTKMQLAGMLITVLKEYNPVVGCDKWISEISVLAEILEKGGRK